MDPWIHTSIRGWGDKRETTKKIEGAPNEEEGKIRSKDSE